MAREVSGRIQDKIGSTRLKQRPKEGSRPTAQCPQCGEAAFRMADRQRTRPDVYGSHTFRLKWLCLDCGHRTESVEEPK
jgi:hypothetical protein